MSAVVGTGVNLNAITPYSAAIINIINGVIVPVLYAVAFLYFIYGVYKYFILGAAEEEARKTGREFILWGIVGFAVIISIWGLVNVVMATFGLGATAAPPFPTIGTPAQNSGRSYFNPPITLPEGAVPGSAPGYMEKAPAPNSSDTSVPKTMSI